MNYSTLALTLPHDTDGVVVDVGSLYARLQTVPDARRRRGQRYSLAVLLLAVVLAKLAGQDRPTTIADWVRERQDFFRTVCQWKRAVTPHADTFRRVLKQAVTVAGLERVAREFLTSAPGAGDSAILCLDGKALRGVALDAEGYGTRLLAAYLPAEGLVLYQAAVASKSNEIPTAVTVLQHLDLQDKIVLADALHTQQEFATTVQAGGGDYVLLAKDNQPTLCRAIAQVFQPETCLPGTSPVLTDLQSIATIEKNRSRLETRRLTTSSCLAKTATWPGLAQVFKLERTTRDLQTGEQTVNVVYGLTSLAAIDASPNRLLELIRDYWHIESQLHWRRDVLFHEDHTRTKSPLLGQACACLNNLVIGLLTRLGWANLARARRHFDAHLDEALKLLVTRLA